MKVLKYIGWSILSAILLVILALMYDDSYTAYIVKNVQKNSEFLLLPDKTKQTTASYNIHIVGYIDGHATLKLYEYYAVKIPERDINKSLPELVDDVMGNWLNHKDDNSYMEIRLSGHVDIKKASEYYGNGFYVKYVPYNVKEGNLKIEYHF